MEKQPEIPKKIPKPYLIVSALGITALLVIIISLVHLVQWKASVKEYNKAEAVYNELMYQTKDVETSTNAPTPIYKKPAAGSTLEDAGKKYLEDLKKYEGRRIQLSNCTATPNQMTWKNETFIMIDNRDDVTATLSVDGTPITVGALDYRILKVQNTSLPHTVKIDCTINGTPKYNVINVYLVE